MTPRKIDGLAEIAGQFDCFLIDQFGVLRDGKGAYPGASDTLIALKEAGKRIIILSNSGKRADENDRRLVQIGFQRASWDLFLTSGEVAFHLMKDGNVLPTGAKSCLLIARDGDRSAVDGLGFDLVESGADADVVLIAASEGDRLPLEHYRALLEPAASRNVPCLCTNPDMVMLTAQGTAFGAGRIAELYQSLGGTVRFIGKPHADIYATALLLLGHPDLSRVVCIGDSVEHDIAGARAAGLASVLVTTGILEHLPEAERNQLFHEHDATPNFMLPSFVWQKGQAWLLPCR